MLNIVIPMAGAGSRFKNAGYTLPKPLIPVHGKSMIDVVVNNLRPKMPHKFVFICQNEHILQFNLQSYLASIAPGCAVVGVDGVTEGAACTVLAASSIIDSDDDVMIANSDQYIHFDINNYLDCVFEDKKQCDGSIMTMKSNSNKWSYVRFNEDKYVSIVVEKEVVSNDATTGIYNFSSGRLFLQSAKSMIAANFRVGGEFYVAPVYNEMINNGKKISAVSIGAVESEMFGLGTPEDLELFLKNAASKFLVENNND